MYLPSDLKKLVWNRFCFLHVSPNFVSDILFSNIKHFFFQPCDHELLVIVHVNLKAPIMIGKKKAHVIVYLCSVSYAVTSYVSYLSRMSNFIVKHLTFSSTKRETGSGSTDMVTKTRSNWSRVNGSEGTR